jgi:O-acetyl-ADP-ribose deacetylase
VKLALPAISTGAYGYPLHDAALIALMATRVTLDAQQTVREARLWLFDDAAHEAFVQQLERHDLAFPRV